MLLIVEIEMVWRRSETELGRGLARSPGLTKVVRPDIVGRRLKESFHCSGMHSGHGSVDEMSIAQHKAQHAAPCTISALRST